MISHESDHFQGVPKISHDFSRIICAKASSFVSALHFFGMDRPKRFSIVVKSDPVGDDDAETTPATNDDAAAVAMAATIMDDDVREGNDVAIDTNHEPMVLKKPAAALKRAVPDSVASASSTQAKRVATAAKSASVAVPATERAHDDGVSATSQLGVGQGGGAGDGRVRPAARRWDAALHGRFMRSMQPASERGARGQKIPENIAAQIAAEGGGPDALRKWSHLYQQSGGDWMTVQLNLSSRHSSGRRGSGNRRWLNDTQMMEVFKSREVVDAKQHHIRQDPSRVRMDPDAPNCLSAQQFHVVLSEEEAWWEEKENTSKVDMSGRMGPAAAKHILPVEFAAGPAPVGPGAPHPTGIPSQFVGLQQLSEQRVPDVRAPLAVPPGTDPNTAAYLAKAHQQALDAQVRSEERAKARALANEAKAAAKAAQRAESERLKGLPESKARAWSGNLVKDVVKAFEYQKNMGVHSNVPESVKTDYAQKFGAQVVVVVVVIVIVVEEMVVVVVQVKVDK